jgi:hypothetical protein
MKKKFYYSGSILKTMKLSTLVSNRHLLFSFLLTFCSLSLLKAQEAIILNPPAYLGYDSTFVISIKVKNTLPLTQMTSVSFVHAGDVYDNTVDSIVIINDSVFSAKIHTGYTITKGNQFFNLYFGSTWVQTTNFIKLNGTKLEMFGTPTRGYANKISFIATPVSTFSLEQDQFISANCQSPDGIITTDIQIDSVEVMAESDFRARISVNNHLAYGWYKVVFMTKKKWQNGLLL